MFLLTRLRTRMCRWKLLRLGLMTYFLLALGLMAILTYPGVGSRQEVPGNVLVENDDVQHLHFQNSEGRDLHADPKVPRDRPVLEVPPVDSDAKQVPGRTCSPVRKVEFLGKPLSLAGEPVCGWLNSRRSMAGGRFVTYGDKMALARDVTLDPAARAPGPKGGEAMAEVWGQSEEAEYFKLKEGFFTMPCTSEPDAQFGTKDHLQAWLAALRCREDAEAATTNNTVRGLTIALQRYEYVNLYHTMTDFFNAFLAMLTFDQHPDDVTILWVDGHPQGGLDDVWGTLFGKVLRAGRLEGRTTFSNMAWAAMGYNSPLNQHSSPEVAYLEEFRHFFLSRHGVMTSRSLNCSSLNWLLVWRRDYVAHPRNKGGQVSRKIANEEALVQAVRGVAGPGDVIKGLQLDALPMKEQLKLIADTDVLLGMHGAGLSHTLFLPPHGGLLELYPTYWPQSNTHFKAMANWRRLRYQTWANQDVANEMPNKSTRVPPEVVSKMATDMRKSICGG